MKFRNFLYLIILAIAVTTFSGCGLFRKKNRCMTCPTWGMATPVPEAQAIHS